MRTRSIQLALVALGSSLLCAACSRTEEQSVAASLQTEATPEASSAEPAPAEPEPSKPEPVALAPYQEELLEVCYEAATKFPLNPHIKNRSRAQELVVQAAFELGDDERALRYTMGIENWRRGSCYADYAYAMAEQGDSATALEYVKKAEPFIEPDADWRGYRILAKIARTHQRLGNAELAAKLAGGIENGTELAAYETERARALEDLDLEEQLAWAEATAQGAQLEEMDLVYQTLMVVYGRLYDDGESRSSIEETLRSIRKSAPLHLTLRTLEDMAEIAIEREDLAHARELSDELDQLIDNAEWHVENEIQVCSRAAGIRYLAGDEEGALEELARLERIYHSSLPRIFDVFRADTLVPLAETYARIGETEKAYETYALALDEGTKNPNSRPRVDDLLLVSLSMLRHDLEPSEEMMERIREVNDELGDPW